MRSTSNHNVLLMTKTLLFIYISLLVTGSAFLCNAQPSHSSTPSTIETSSLNKEITDFLDKEMTAHLNDIKSYDPAPDKVFAAGTTGKAASKTNGTETAAANGEPAAARWARARPQYVMDGADMISSPCPARYFIRARQRSPLARCQAWPR